MPYDDIVETDVQVPTPDGTADAALFHPAGDGQWPAVLVWPDAMGLRPVLRRMARRVATEGYVVLLPNQYYRVRTAPVLDESFDFSNPDDRARLSELMGGVTSESTERDAV